MTIKVITVDRTSYAEGANPYLPLLVDALTKHGVIVTSLYSHAFTIVDMIFAPLRLALLKLNGYKIFHFHWGLFAWSRFRIIFFLKLLNLLGYKVIWTVHEARKGGDFETGDFEKSARFAYENCSALICFGEATKKYLIKKFGYEKPVFVTIVHGPYDCYKIESEEPDLNIPDDAKTFLLFGVLRREKNVDQLISAFQKLNRSYSKTHLIIAGRPFPENSGIKERIEKLSSGNSHIKLLIRSIKDSEVHTLFDAANFVVLSYAETSGFSGVLMLAATFGKPVIAAKSGAAGLIGETVTKYGLGIVYDDSMLQALEKANNISSEQYSEFVKNCKTFCASRSWDIVARETKYSYEYVLRAAC